MKKFVILFISLFTLVNLSAQKRICPTCSGYKVRACTACYGNGYVWVPVQTIYGIQNQQYTCKNCSGYGVITCRTCKGKGVVYANSRSNRNISFGSKYDCERCLCPRYNKKSTFNSDCKNCDHPKSWHYSQK